jgi:hypothetical protein
LTIGTLYQLLAGIPRMAKGMFNYPGAYALCFNTQYPVLIMQVHIPPDDTLKAVEVRANVVNVFSITEVSLENKDVHM